MSELINDKPPLDSVEDLELAKNLDEVDISQDWIDVSRHYEEPPFLLSYKGSEFCTIGDIQAITGTKKNGKSFFATILAAVILGSDRPKVQQRFPGLTVNMETLKKIGHLPKILYVDTEQSEANTVKIVRRIHWLIDYPMDKPHERLKMLWLRTTSDPHERWLKIKKAIIEENPTVVFIDGIRDLMRDFNDLQESNELIGELMRFTTTKKCSIWCCLHTNPGSTKMRGHVGTELGNKVSDTFILEKTKKGSEVTFKAIQVDARNKDVEDVEFLVNEDAGKLGVPRFLTVEDLYTKGDDPELIRRWLIDGRTHVTWPATVGEIKKMLKEVSGIGKGEILQANIDIAKNRRFIIPQSKDEYEDGQRHPKYNLSNDIDQSGTPFESSGEEAPF